MAEISLDVLAEDARVFDIVHGMVEDRLPVLGIAHTMFDNTLDRLELSLRARVAIGLGIRTFEIVSGPELSVGFNSVGFLRYATQTERTGNFLIQLIEDMNEAALRLPDTAPELAEASTRIVIAHLQDSAPDLVMSAHSGAGIMHEVFSEAYLTTLIGDELS